MSFKSWLLGGESTVTEQVASPWADNSHLETITLASLYGMTPDDSPITRKSAMSIASVAKARGLICGSVARMPILAMKNGVPLESQPVMLSQMQRGVPNFTTISWVVDHLMFYGRSFLLITDRDFQGRPSNLRFVPESEAETKDGELIKAFGQSVPRNSYIRIDHNVDPFLSIGREVLKEARDIERSAREASASPVPSIVLKQREGTNLSAAEVEAMRTAWSSARAKKHGSVAFANKAVDVEQLGAAAEHLLINGRNQATLQIARALGLPGWALDAVAQGSSLSYSNQASRNRELLDALSPYLESIEGHLSLFLPHGTEAKFNTEELLKEDTKTRFETYAVALNAGFLTKDEVRARENLEPLPEEEIPVPATVPAPPVPEPEEVPNEAA